MNTKFNIIHEADKQRFKIAFAGDTAELTYFIQGNKIHFTHAYTPVLLRGRGVAAQLVEAGLAYASAENLTPIPVCSYVVSYMRDRR